MSSSPPPGPWDAPPPTGQPYGGGRQGGSEYPRYPSGGEPPSGPSGSTQGDLAGWWYRVGATVIDEIILGIVGLVFQLALGRVAGDIIGAAINAAYLIILVGGPGQTIGCLAVGTKVVASDGSPQVGYGKAAVRWIMPLVLLVLLVIPAILDWLWPLWDSQNQTLHDKAAKTLVIRAR